MNRATRVAWPALTFLAAVLVSVAVAVAIGGGFDGAAIGRIVARLALDAGAAVVLGAAVLVVLVLPDSDPRRSRLLDVAAVAAALWTVAAAVTVFLLYLGTAPAPSDPQFGPGLVAFVEDVAVGRSWLIAAVLAAVLTAALVAARSRTGIAVLGIAAAIALVPVALQAPLSSDPLALAHSRFAAELVQLVGLGAWTGLVALRLVLDGPEQDRRRSHPLAVGCGVVVLVGALLGAGPQLAEGTPIGVIAARTVLIVAALLVTIGRRRAPGSAPDRVALPLLGVLAGLSAAIDVVGTSEAQLPARTSPAAILTGAPLPAPASLLPVLLDGRPDALWLVGCAVLLVGYVGAVIALRRRGTAWPVRRTVAWAVGVVVLGWLTSGGPARYQEVLVSAHLAQHAAVLLLVPLLLAAGAPARLLEGAGLGAGDPPRLRTAALRVLRSPAVGAIARPVPASVLAVVVLGGLYGTDLLGWSVAGPVGAETALVVCFGVGCLLVAALVSAPRRSAVTAAAVLLLVESGAAAVLSTGSGLLLAGWFGAMGWGTDALDDQHAGAAVAWVLLAVPTAALLVAAVLRAPSAAPAQPSTVNRTPEEVPA